jgi:hypothetical protein
VTRGIVETRLADRVFHLGPPRDRPIFAGLEVNFAPVETADYVVCSGLFDDTIETPENYREMLALMRRRSLFMVCANPDVVVERGDTLVYCAGAFLTRMSRLAGRRCIAASRTRQSMRRLSTKPLRFVAARCRRLPGSWRSAIRSAPTLPARLPSAWISCSSSPAYTLINSACAERRT